MTASVAPDVSDGAPQAINEPHSARTDTVQKREIWRFWILVFFFGFLTIMVLVPLFVHQVLQFGQELPAGMPHQGQPMRGTIVDRHGAVLAADRYFYQVTTTPTHFTNDEDRMAVAKKLEELAGVPSAKTFDLLTQYADQLYVELAPKISLEAGERIHAEQQKLAVDHGLDPLLQINLTATPERYYPEKTLASQIVGMLARRVVCRVKPGQTKDLGTIAELLGSTSCRIPRAVCSEVREFVSGDSSPLYGDRPVRARWSGGHGEIR